jgi:hypothetical protein
VTSIVLDPSHHDTFMVVVCVHHIESFVHLCVANDAAHFLR